MGLVHGSVAYRRFRVTDSLPKGFHEKLVVGLQRHAFREITPGKNSEQSVGWVNGLDPLDADLTLDKVIIGRYIFLGIRWDRKNVSTLLLKAKLAERIRATLAERRVKKLSREEVTQIRQATKDALIASVSPTTTVYEVLWDVEKSIVYLSTHTARIADMFVDLFIETTGLEIEEDTLVSRVEQFAEARGGEEIDIETLEETSFV